MVFLNQEPSDEVLRDSIVALTEPLRGLQSIPVRFGLRVYDEAFDVQAEGFDIESAKRIVRTEFQDLGWEFDEAVPIIPPKAPDGGISFMVVLRISGASDHDRAVYTVDIELVELAQLTRSSKRSNTLVETPVLVTTYSAGNYASSHSSRIAVELPAMLRDVVDFVKDDYRQQGKRLIRSDLRAAWSDKDQEQK